MEIFEKVVGNDLARRRLELLCSTMNVPHLLLFTGIAGIGKRLFAKELAHFWLQKKSNTVSYDLHIFSPEGKTGMHSIQAVRRLIDEVNMAPFSSENKAFIIDDAERMLPTSANALLKTLEEPPKNTLIILVSNAPERLLTTIISRSQQVRFCPLSEQEIVQILIENQKIDQENAQNIAKRAHGSMALGLKLLQQEGELFESSLYLHLSKKRRFHEIAQIAKEFQKGLDAKRKVQESELKAQYAPMLKESTSSQRQLIEQEIEGALSLSSLQSVQELFYTIQAFFCDLERLQQDLPLHFDSQRSILLQALSTGRKMPFERVSASIQQAKQAIERSSPVQSALESLLLQIN